MLKVFICEDNDIQRKQYEKMINNVIIIENLDMKLELSANKPESILQYLNENKVNGLYFLDIDLKNKINGITLAEKIREFDPRGFIVFITTHAEMSYLTFLYKVEAMDYIIKDHNDNISSRIKQCILNANKKYLIQEEETHKQFILKVDDKVISIKLDDILFFETSSTIHKVIMHCKSRIIEFYSKMKDIEDKLDERFYRCHRSYLINMNNIKEIDVSNRVLYMINDEECLISTRALKGLLTDIEKIG